jgi:hypothetical protein
MTGWPVWSLCQIAVVRARMRCRTRAATPAGVCPLCRPRSSWPLNGSLADSMTWRRGLKNRVPGRAGSPWRAAQQAEAVLGNCGLELVAVVGLVRDDDLPRPARRSRPGHRGRPGAPAAHQLWRRSARTRRAGRAWWRADAAAVPRSSANGWRTTRTAPIRPGQSGGPSPRERPHSTGVASATPTSSDHRLVSQASTAISQAILAASARSCLMYRAAGAGEGNIPRRWVPACCSQRPSEVAQQHLHHRQRDLLHVAGLRADASYRAPGGARAGDPAAGHRF